MQNPAPPGHRHHQALKIAVSLIGQGLSPNAVFAQLREMHKGATDFSDSEILNLIDWACTRNPSPCGGANSGLRVFSPQSVSVPTRIPPEQAIRNAKDFLKGWHCTIADLWHVSPWHPSEDWRNDSAQLIAALYEPTDFINIVTDFTVEKQRDGTNKACPRGAGKTLVRDDWLKRLRIGRTPCSAAGTWIRPNPVKGSRGSGKHGAHTDADVAAFRFLLLESDALSIGLQLSLWARLALPVAAIIDSGGRSIHACVKLDCKDEAEYREVASFIYERLLRFGLCPSNKNPSRLARLPGVKRKIGAVGASEQRLYYLNDDPSGKPIFEKDKIL
jgi:hypothetical protein